MPKADVARQGVPILRPVLEEARPRRLAAWQVGAGCFAAGVPGLDGLLVAVASVAHGTGTSAQDAKAAARDAFVARVEEDEPAKAQASDLEPCAAPRAVGPNVPSGLPADEGATWAAGDATERADVPS